MTNNLTSEQKLDYIYKTLKNQKRFFMLKIFIKILIFTVFIYFIFVIIPSYNKDKIYNDFSKKISDLVVPIVTNIIENMNLEGGTDVVNNMGLSNDIIKKIKDNPEILDRLIKK